MKSLIKKTVFLGILLTIASSCQKEEFVTSALDWRENTHSNLVEPNYDKVFDQTRVNRIDIVLTEAEFSDMQSNFSSLVSSNDTQTNPDYFSCDFFFNGIQWYDVGVRYKGNSNAFDAFNAGNGKLPFKLDFDEFESVNKDIEDQRFYGFGQLSLHPNFNDNSQIREKLALDIYRAFDVPAPLTSFYEVYVDKGNGIAEYFGLYTLIEDFAPDLLERQFLSKTGNSYESQNAGSKLYSDQFELTDFIPKTNQDITLNEDIQELFDVLNSSLRITDLEQWKQSLEAVFDVDGFLKYLAVNNLIQNWDTYGNKRGNYYLYHDPADDLLKWVVRGANEAFKSEGKESPVSLSMLEVTTYWPLINYLIRIPDYDTSYKGYLSSFSNTVFTPAKMDNLYNKLQQYVAPSSANETSNYTHIQGGESALESEFVSLKAHTYQRLSEVESYLE